VSWPESPPSYMRPVYANKEITLYEVTL
jgi:hypothetical protein